MTKRLITPERTLKTEGTLNSRHDVGVDALNAFRSIPGIENPEIVSESDTQVTMEYSWTGDSTYWETDEHLKRFAHPAGICWRRSNVVGGPLTSRFARAPYPSRSPDTTLDCFRHPGVQALALRLCRHRGTGVQLGRQPQAKLA